MEKKEENNKNREILSELSSKIGGLLLQSCLITPIQRFPRYILFLKELKKYTPSCHPDQELFSIAYQKISDISELFDIKTKENIDFQTMNNLKTKLVNTNTFVKNRNIILQMDVLLHGIDNQNKIKLIFFSDYVLLYQPSESKYKIIFENELDSLRYFIDYPEKNYLSFVHCEPKKNNIISISFVNKKDFSDVVKFLYVPCTKDDTIFIRSISSSTLLHEVPSVCAGSNSNGIFIIDSKHFNNQIFVLDPFNGNSSCQPFPDDDPIVPAKRVNIFVYELGFFLIGGKNSKGFRTSTLFSSDSGISVINLPRAVLGRVGFSVDFYNNFLYLFGGESIKGLHNDVLEFNISKPPYIFNILSTKGVAPSVRREHTGTVYKDKLYIFGGKNKLKIYSNVSVFNLKSRQWEYSHKLPKSCQRSGHQAVLRNGHLLIFTENDLTTVLCIDISNMSSENPPIYQNIQISGNYFSNFSGYSIVSLNNGNLVALGGHFEESKPLNIIQYIRLPSIYLPKENFSQYYPVPPNLSRTEEGISLDLLDYKEIILRSLSNPNIANNLDQSDLRLSSNSDFSGTE